MIPPSAMAAPLDRRQGVPHACIDHGDNEHLQLGATRYAARGRVENLAADSSTDSQDPVTIPPPSFTSSSSGVVPERAAAVL